MRKKFFGFDLDGTLLNRDHEVMPETKKVLKDLRTKGNYVALVTGRGLLQSLPIMEKLKLNGIDVTLVGNNGSIYLREIGKKLKIMGSVTKETCDLFFQISKDCGGILMIHSEGKTYYHSSDVSRMQGINDLGGGVSVSPSQISDEETIKEVINSGNINQITIKDYPPIIEKLAESIEKTHLENNELVIVGRKFMDFSPKGCNKFSSIIQICNELGIEKEDIYTFGDSMNDISMMRKDINSVAMINGLDKIKEAAKYITKKDNNNDGIADWINTNVKY